MIRRTAIEHRFVESAPEALDDGVLYVSIPYSTALHLCPCGCGSEIVTPISRQGWTLAFDGESISLHPSIGNWNYPCRSHYWIRRDRIEWARPDLRDRPAAPVVPPSGQHHHGVGYFADLVRRIATGIRVRRQRHRDDDETPDHQPLTNR